MKVQVLYKNSQFRDINLEESISEKSIKKAQNSIDEFNNIQIENESLYTNVKIKNLRNFVEKKDVNIEYEIYVGVRDHDIKDESGNQYL